MPHSSRKIGTVWTQLAQWITYSSHMTESQWLASTNPGEMLLSLRSRTSDRKLRLFAVACCRRVWDLLNDDRSKRAVEVAEAYADGHVPEEGLRFARTCAAEAWDFAVRAPASWPPVMFAMEACAHCASPSDQNFLDEVIKTAHYAQRNHGRPDSPKKKALETEDNAAQSNLLRDIFGNDPFRPIPLDRSRLTPQHLSLAQTIYDQRDFARMPELADALQQAGCTDPDILAHGRDPGPHARGSWVIDLVLGKQ